MVSTKASANFNSYTYEAKGKVAESYSCFLNFTIVGIYIYIIAGSFAQGWVLSNANEVEEHRVAFYNNLCLS